MRSAGCSARCGPSPSSCAPPGRPRRATSSARSDTPRRASCRSATFSSLEDLQGQHDAWADDVAYRRHIRRLGGTVAQRFGAERGFLGPLPDPLPDTDLRLEARAGIDAFVRVLGADYSVPPAFVGRRVAIRVTQGSVRLSSEGTEIAVHVRSFVPADVVLAPAHGRAIRLAREARDRLVAGDIELPDIDLTGYDALIGVLP